MFGWKLVKKGYLNKLEYDKDYYFHRCQEAEDKNFELEEEVYELNKYVEELYSKIYNRYGFSSINSLYRLNLHTERCEEYNYESLVINLVPIRGSVDIEYVPEWRSTIDSYVIDYFGKRMSEEFKKYIVKELKRDFGYE